MLATEPASSSSTTSYSIYRLELSRSMKENHSSPILKIAVPSSTSPFHNIVAVLSSNQVNIYDTDNLDSGHFDIISHYSSSSSNGVNFVDCCWLSNEEDGYLAILLDSGSIQLLSLTYSAIISSIDLPPTFNVTKIFPDPADCERLFGLDIESDSLHIFSYDSSTESPLIGCEGLEGSQLFASDGNCLLEVTQDRQRMRPFFFSHDSDSETNIVALKLSTGKIEFASIRGNDYFIIDDRGRIFFLNASESFTIPASLWSDRLIITHDGDNLIAILLKSGNVVIFDMNINKCSVLKGAVRVKQQQQQQPQQDHHQTTTNPKQEVSCVFISVANCCSQGIVKRILTSDPYGLLCIYRIVL